MKLTTTLICLFFSCFGLASLSMAHAAEVRALDAKQQAMVVISSFSASGNLQSLKTALNEGLDAGLTVNEIKEILVQVYAYAGFPRSLNAISTFMDVLDERESRGIRDEAGREPTPLPTDKSSLEFGTANQTQLIGNPVSGAIYDFAPAIDQFLKAHLFGDIFQRDNLDWTSRELVTIAILASIDGLAPQLRGHYAIGMRNGLSREQLEATVALLGNRTGKKVGDHAGEVLKNLLDG